ncbi:unnamed protein product [Oppiella nova]|uniref:RING-type domain-containing protein n=1 Tax=Oppiella nova TaxID=334625 RepID=A0A7R9QLS6_9ACAR|nr:unnamed protein product [Oppiella nova]CAG2168504.1 unnamed protein product [Oppiella nova]
MSGFDKTRVVGVSDEELDEYTCGICLQVFVNPVVTQCCQQSYCSECINGWLSDNNTCPNDRKSLSREGVGPAPRVLVNLLNKMKVKCDFYLKGCESVVKMCELLQHLDYCDYSERQKCKTCELPIDGNTQHNCIDNLLIQNQSLRNDNQRLEAEVNKLSMNRVISLARKDLDNVEVRSQTRMSSSEVNLCIETSQEAIGIDKSRVVGVSDEELNEFLCGICLAVVVHPMVTQCCQQCYCRECIHSWLSNSNTCPNDRKRLYREDVCPAPRLVTNLLNKMQVKCEFYDKGCESVVKMCELTQHIDYCDYNERQKCKTCHSSDLLIKNQSLCDEIEKLKADYKKLSMKGVIETARNNLDDYQVIYQINISSSKLDLCIKRAKEAISCCDTYTDITSHIFNAFNTRKRFSKRWHCIAFAGTGDKSRVVGVSVEELDEYTCGICLQVFVNPVVTQCCQQTYCSECIYGWLSDHNTCPNDRKKLSREGVGPAPRFVINLLNNMKCMEGVIESARKDLDNCTVKSRTNLSSSEVELCIERSKEAIRRCNSFSDISAHIHNVFNDNRGVWAIKQWHCNAFSKHGGESLVSPKQYCRLVFGLLRIEIFSTAKN